MELDVYQTGPLQVNTYILKDFDSKEAVIIDLGGDFENIKSKLDKDGYNIKFILNTHGHFDHVLGEVEVQKKYPNIPILMHKDDISHFSRLKEEMTYFGFKSDTEPINPERFIDETTRLTIGKNEIKIFHTPGHSAGSLSYYVDGKLFSGDALFYRSIGRTDFYDGDFDTLINSIKIKMFSLPDSTEVYPGHGPKTTIINEKRFNTYLND